MKKAIYLGLHFYFVCSVSLLIILGYRFGNPKSRFRTNKLSNSCLSGLSLHLFFIIDTQVSQHPLVDGFQPFQVFTAINLYSGQYGSVPSISFGCRIRFLLQHLRQSSCCTEINSVDFRLSNYWMLI